MPTPDLYQMQLNGKRGFTAFQYVEMRLPHTECGHDGSNGLHVSSDNKQLFEMTSCYLYGMPVAYSVVRSEIGRRPNQRTTRTLSVGNFTRLWVREPGLTPQYLLL